MRRRKLTLRLNPNVVEEAKNLGINLCNFLEVKLVEYMSNFIGTPRGRISCIITSKIILFHSVI